LSLIFIITITVILVLVLRKPNNPHQDLNTRLDKKLLAWADAYKKYGGNFTQKTLPKYLNVTTENLGDGEGLLGAFEIEGGKMTIFANGSFSYVHEDSTLSHSNLCKDGDQEYALVSYFFSAPNKLYFGCEHGMLVVMNFEV